MRKITLLFVLVAIIASEPLFGLADQYSFYKHKTETYSKAKIAGIRWSPDRNDLAGFEFIYLIYKHLKLSVRYVNAVTTI